MLIWPIGTKKFAFRQVGELGPRNSFQGFFSSIMGIETASDPVSIMHPSFK